MPESVQTDPVGHLCPVLVAKHQRPLPGFDDHVVGMYARGMSVCEIQGHLLEPYAQQVSPSLISTITDKVMAEAKEWFMVQELNRWGKVVKETRIKLE